MSDLNLALIGNGRIAMLIDATATVVWGCFPRFDSDPTFCSLLSNSSQSPVTGFWSTTLEDLTHHEQQYVPNTPVLTTRMVDRQGGEVEITDIVPRFKQFGRTFCPMILVRRVRRIAGYPRVRVRLRPAREWGRGPAHTSQGSHHLRFVMPDVVLRLTTDASIAAVQQEQAFLLQDEINLILGPDETVTDRVSFVAERFHRETVLYWLDWVRNLDIPFEWQDAVIRAAITLKLNTFDDSGAVIAAVTTSIPESAGTTRNWDYRYCWLRDAYFVINALNRLSATRTMEHFIAFIMSIAAGAPGGALKPLYRIDGSVELDESTISHLAGYRGMGPVRIGNLAHLQIQHDVYGAAVLASIHMFFDQRLKQMGDQGLFERMEIWGEQAAARFDQPDAGPWELRGSMHIHTFSSVMCWVACDRLARIASRLNLKARGEHWGSVAESMRATILSRSWSTHHQSFVSTFDGHAVDASLLLLPELRIVSATDPRFGATVARIERELKVGDFIFRYRHADDFGAPENAFLVCTFWYIDALAAMGRHVEARALFERMLHRRNRHGLLSEHIDPHTGELWGNFVQTYSMVGLINSAVRLSVPWEEAF